MRSLSILPEPFDTNPMLAPMCEQPSGTFVRAERVSGPKGLCLVVDLEAVSGPLSVLVDKAPMIELFEGAAPGDPFWIKGQARKASIDGGDFDRPVLAALYARNIETGKQGG